MEHSRVLNKLLLESTDPIDRCVYLILQVLSPGRVFFHSIDDTISHPEMKTRYKKELYLTHL